MEKQGRKERRRLHSNKKNNGEGMSGMQGFILRARSYDCGKVPGVLEMHGALAHPWERHGDC